MYTWKFTIPAIAALAGNSLAAVNIGIYSHVREGNVAWIDGHDACSDWMPTNDENLPSLCTAEFTLSNNAGYRINCPNGYDGQDLNTPNDPWGLQEVGPDGSIGSQVYTCHFVGDNPISCSDGTDLNMQYQCD